MKLWVLRHGEAVSHARSDAERALTSVGQQQALTSAARLHDQPLDAILASPYVRAQQTAALAHGVLPSAPAVRTVPWLTPDSDPLAVIGHLEKLGLDNVLLVSHQPLVGNLLSLLVHGNLRQPEPMQTASLAELQGEWPLAGLMSLHAVHHP
ncbi:phosphohistidine phosphatase SixA [Pseudomonas rhizosphaerae]|jgi:phosphohistidine phosphatase|uniref:Phosphohistidine phosphatase n=1 Tax=Pseudomonas rhizosphaerae TaxID=216142 RepID=A0A089YKT2_9PSED|nr:phosphohistidine phosphatase SixA [Pseudomonas rhizosphaerae]AIS16988.1 phosphohistidine phosphatase [Pseudomonas rhizosphaerae]MBD8612544.1 phosphohistidine phosphatase SixA [Pseudomonas putida]MEB2869154.1 phosphohistidine phosphatase SixA [Pseudomonas rhizosphaerae]